MKIVVGARASPLSLAQVKEVAGLLPHLLFEIVSFETTGDRDQKTSLKTLDKTDFFTKEIDQALLESKVRIAIHSAKDLPEPLPVGLKVIALTRGVDPSDVLVFREKTVFESPPLIATSSLRREEAVLKLLPSAKFTDIRGTVNERLRRLDEGLIDGVVVAEAALIRLGLTERRRVTLPGETTPYQGQLAILAREDDMEIQSLFSSIDVRKKVSLGVTRPNAIDVIHAPFIEIEEMTPSFEGFEGASHLLFTSKTAVKLFFRYYKGALPKIIAIGEGTAKEVLSCFGVMALQPLEATQEGVVALLKTLPIKKLFWPRSESARDVIERFAFSEGMNVVDVPFYRTVIKKNIPNLNWDLIEEIFFTSPSTVEAYIAHFGKLPARKVCHSIGPVTKQSLSLIF